MKNATRSWIGWPGPACFLGAAGLLSAGFNHPEGLAVLLSVSIALLAWWRVQWPGWRWLPAALLILTTGTAAGGVLLGYHPALMIAGAATALAGWEMTEQYSYRLDAGIAAQQDGTERSHFQLLAGVVVFGLVIAEVGLFLHVSMPFWGVFLAGLLILFCLYRFYQTFNRT